MSLVIKIDSVDKTSIIDTGSLRIKDKLNNRTNECSFTLQKYSDVGIVPVLNDEVEITLDGVKIFAGVITSYSDSVAGKNRIEYEVVCKDYSQYFNRKLVTERYEDKTIDFIIDDLLSRYATDFTAVNVNADIEVDSIAFNRITMSECLEKLVKLVSFSWYIDYDKDIHFFTKNTEIAPFSITDTSDNYIYNSLELSKDLSQIRNKIFVQGGEEVGDIRDETFDGDGVKSLFRLAYKYSSKPTVTVDGIAQLVGIENLQDEIDFDCMWDFNQKYVRFKDTTLPVDGSDNVEVEGTPLFPILVEVPNPVSIGEYGEYEYAIKDTAIRSRQEGIDRAIAELEAYASEVSEGNFSTYRKGLRSGLTITVNSPLRGVNENFLIQSVDFRVMSVSGDAEVKYIYSINLATLKTIGIIDVLQKLLLDEDLSEGEQETLLTYLQFKDTIGISDSIGTPTTTSAPYKYSNNEETTPSRGRYGFATYS